MKSKVGKVFNFFVIISLLIMVALVFLNAVLRYGFNSSILAAEELSRFFFIWITYLGIISAFKDDDHVSVTIVTDYLKGIPKIIFAIVKYIIILATMIVILLGGIQFTKMSNYLTVATKTNFALITVSIVVATLGIIILLFKKIKDEIELSKKGEE